MNATTLPPNPPPATGRPVIDYLRTLTAEEKDAALAELIREAIRVSGGRGLIPVTAPDGESLGFHVPPAAAAGHPRALLPALSAEQRAVTAAALADPPRTFDMSAFLDDLSRGDPD